jgi:hypothetical protein
MDPYAWEDFSDEEWVDEPEYCTDCGLEWERCECAGDGDELEPLPVDISLDDEWDTFDEDTKERRERRVRPHDRY